MQSSFTSTAIRLFRYLDALQIAFIRAVLEQPKCRKALRLGLLVMPPNALSMATSPDERDASAAPALRVGWLSF